MYKMYKHEKVLNWKKIREDKKLVRLKTESKKKDRHKLWQKEEKRAGKQVNKHET